MVSSGIASLNRDQIMQLFLTQLQNQDPLEPVNDKDMVTQMAQLSSMEGMEKLNASFSDMLHLQQLTQGGSILGHNVSYTPLGSTTPTRGVASQIDVVDGKVMVTVGTDTVSLDQIRSVEP